MRRIDVSMPLFAGMPAFPGDPVFGTAPLRRIERGDDYSLSSLSLGSHTGTHVDPPSHFVAGGATIDAIDLAALNGPCEVVDVPESSSSVGPEELPELPAAADRILFRTSNSARWADRLRFFRDYVALTLPAAQRLRERRVRLVGIDALSVENDPTGRFAVHRELLGHGILVLEGLLLDAAPAGSYHLECLPLRLQAGDGGPARAILVEE
jgi:arylformamidase